jgi:hypothetical protein
VTSTMLKKINFAELQRIEKNRNDIAYSL